MRHFVLLLSLLALTACAGSSKVDNPPQAAGEVNLERYQGTWYELARLPMFFQRNCAQSEAHYDLRQDGRIGVTNRCRTHDDQWEEATGYAVPQVEGRTDRFWVRFDNWFSRLFPGLTKGAYWILYLDPDYRTALVGNPNREYLWLLAREPVVSAKTVEHLLSEALARGYDTSQLVWRVPDAQIEAD